MTYKKTVYLDNAASSFPKPQSVINSMYRIMVKNTSNPGRSGHKMSDENARLIYETRKESAELFGISDTPENVIFTHNATHAINLAINGIIHNGDDVIISDMEHNSVLRPLAEREKDGMITFKPAKVSTDDEETVENFRKLIKQNTRMIFVTHASNVNGKTLPVKRLASLCKEYGIIFCLDASQTAGHISCDMSLLGIDILCTAGHKGLLGPQGTGLLAVKSGIELKPLIFGGTGEASLLKLQPIGLPESLESGTMNTVGIAGLGEGIRFIKKNGEFLEKKADYLYKKLYKGLKSIPEIKIYSAKENPTHTLAFNVKDIPSEKITQILNNNEICVRGGFHCSALYHEKMRTLNQGAVRASIGVFNTEEDINRCIKICKTLCKQ